MRRRTPRSGGDGREPGGPRLRPADVVITVVAALGAAYLFFGGRWVPGWERSFAAFLVIGAGPPVLRALAHRWPRWGALDFLASFWLLPAVAVGHGMLGPVLDALGQPLRDGALARMDLALFGAHPSHALGELLGPWGVEVALICYYTYFLWPVALGGVLFLKGSRQVFDGFLLALALCFSFNFLLYATVPAIGPRFYLSHLFEAPLRGVLLAPLLDSAMRTAPFLRDCFPSGHTAGTLLVMTYAYRHARRFFWVMLPFGLGLIAATLIGRFHYAIDLVAAVPLVLAVLGLASLHARWLQAAQGRRAAPAVRWGARI